MNEGPATNNFAIGQRVKIIGHWEVADGIVGTITEPAAAMLELSGPDEWQGHRRFLGARNKTIVSYFVVFDEPADDGSRDGPYLGGEIESDCLVPIAN